MYPLDGSNTRVDEASVAEQELCQNRFPYWVQAQAVLEQVGIVELMMLLCALETTEEHTWFSTWELILA